MKTISKSQLLTVAVAASLLVPSLTLAQDGSDSHDLPGNKVITATASPSPRLAATPKIEVAELCTKMGDLATSVSGETNNRFGQLSTDFDKRNDNVAGKFADAAAKIAAARAAADAKRQANFTKLEAKATTEAQKQAVVAFEAAVLKAVTTRRAAVDAADASFKASVLAAINQRQTQLKAAATTYKAAVAAAIAAAKASCAAGGRPATVRQTLQTALKAARASLQTAVQAADKVRPNLDPMKATHKAAIVKADTDFKTAVDAALATLKAALGVTPSPSPSPGA